MKMRTSEKTKQPSSFRACWFLERFIELDAAGRENSNRLGGHIIRLFDFRGFLGLLVTWNLRSSWLDTYIADTKGKIVI
jgi:hypothetical protein